MNEITILIINFSIHKDFGKRLKWTMNDFEININTATVHGATYGIKEFFFTYVLKKLKRNLELMLFEEKKKKITLTNLKKVLIKKVIITTLNFDNIYESSEGRYPDNQCYYKYGYCGNGYQFNFGSCRNHYHYY